MVAKLTSIASVGFSEIANLLVDRISKLLITPVFVTDHQGIVITSSEPDWIGLPFQAEDGTIAPTLYVRIPLQHEALHGEVIVGASCQQEPISPQLAQTFVEFVIQQTTTRNQPDSKHELKNQFINDLLHDRIADEALLLCRAKRLGMDLNPPRAVILIDAADYILPFTDRAPLQSSLIQQRRSQTVIQSIVSFFLLPNDTICADLGQGRIAVLKASDTKNLDPWVDRDQASDGASSSWANLTALKRAADALLLRLRSDTGTAINVGIGRYHPGIRGLARSYADAQAALSLGNRFHGHNRVHCLGELGVAAFVGVADEQTKVDLAKYLLSPLDHEPELLTTLATFFAEDCCPSLTAKQLSVHRNTLGYRFDKITSLTGLDPRKFDQAVQIRLALLLRSLKSSQS